MRIRTKITLLFFAITTVGLILLHASIFYFVYAFNFEDFFKRLEARVKLSAEINILSGDNPETYRNLRSRYLEKLENEHDYIIRVSPNGYFAKPLNLPDSFYQTVVKKGETRYAENNHFYAGGFYKTQNAAYIVIVGATDPHGFKELGDLKNILGINFLMAALLGLVAGYVFSYYTVKPIDTFNKSVNNITANNLHLRLPQLKGKDEIAGLTLTFNNMLTRLETAFETQNNFVSNASHELRTPLAVLTSETELLLADKTLSPAATACARTILGEAEKLEQILTSLLGLAQSGFDGKKQNWQKIRVDELVLNSCKAVKKIYPESVLELDFISLPEDDEQLYTEGNSNLLELALSNIMLNGCKYSNNQPVKICVSSENGLIILSVTDHGIGIPKQEQQHIFEPFFRASNTLQFAGHGIGLPLTQNIIRLHSGTISIRSEVEIGTEIQIVLPVA